MWTRLDKRPIAAMLAALCVWSLGLAAQVCADDDEMPPLLTTQGHAEAKVRPDALSFNAQIEATSNTLVQVRQAVQSKSQRLIAALKNNAPAHLVLTTEQFRVAPITHDAHGKKLPRLLGYRGTMQVRVQLSQHPPEQLGTVGAALMDAALRHGADQVDGLAFYLENPAKERRTLMAKAVEDAAENAKAMAQAAGIALSGVHTLDGCPSWGGGGVFRSYPMAAMKADMAEMAPAPLETGEQQLTCDVTLRYRIAEPHRKPDS
jgi:hypothetical protein